MLIAVTYDNGSVFQHFGHTEEFKVYTVEDGKVVSSSLVSSDGQGHGVLATLLSQKGVDALICGGIGPGAVNALSQLGVRVYAGVTGDADKAVSSLLDGTLQYSDGANCSHHHEDGHSCHDHEEGHSCHHHDDGHSCSCHH